LKDNSISSLNEVYRLKCLTRLTDLSLQGNPVCENKALKPFVIAYVPSLKSFDGNAIDVSARIGANRFLAGAPEDFDSEFDDEANRTESKGSCATSPEVSEGENDVLRTPPTPSPVARRDIREKIKDLSIGTLSFPKSSPQNAGPARTSGPTPPLRGDGSAERGRYDVQRYEGEYPPLSPIAAERPPPLAQTGTKMVDGAGVGVAAVAAEVAALREEMRTFKV
jgi:hypothetical protein